MVTQGPLEWRPHKEELPDEFQRELQLTVISGGAANGVE